MPGAGLELMSQDLAAYVGLLRDSRLVCLRRSGWLYQISNEERQEAHESERTHEVKRQRSTRVEVLWRQRWIVQTLGIP